MSNESSEKISGVRFVNAAKGGVVGIGADIEVKRTEDEDRRGEVDLVATDKTLEKFIIGLPPGEAGKLADALKRAADEANA